jgi:glycosyltransferase involved in cell wall biosynthesis
VRVVVVSAWEPWRISDGAAFVLHHQLRVLAARHDVSLIAAGAPSATSVTKPTLAADLPVSKVQWFGSRTGPKLDHIGRRLWSMRHGEPAHVAFVERPGLVAALRDAVDAGVDVVHLHGWGTAALWREVGETPTVHVAIDPWTANVGNRRRSGPRRLVEWEQRHRIERHEREHYPHLGAVVVVTDRDAAMVRELAPSARVEVVPNGVEPGPDPVALPSRPVLGFHGVFDSQANVDAARSLVHDVLPRVRRTVPAAEVLLVGRRPPREVRTLAGDGVRVMGDVPDLRAALDDVTVHVDWMTSGAGIKNKVLEAMAAGRPVVSTSLGAEGIGDGPGLLVAADLDDAAATISDLLRDLPAATETGRAARQRVIEDFSWASNADRIEALWAQVST